MVVRVVVDDRGPRDPRLELGDPRLEEALLVLGRVVLEVLGQVAEPAGRRDRLDRSRPARPLELRELGLEGLHLLARQHLATRHAAEATGPRPAAPDG